MLALHWSRTISGSRFFWLLTFISLFLLTGPAAPAEAGTFSTATYNGRTYKIFVPAGYTSSTAVPLIVMLHGCTQNADTFAAGTQMNTLAESDTFIAIYPVQPSSANSSQCWNWFEPAHQSRGAGEPALIAGMVNQVKNNYTIDDNRVYVTGLSSGGAMSVIMGATYPDLFAAIGVASGLEYKAATSSTAAWTAMFSGGPNATTQGNLAYTAMGSQARTVPVIVFHGSADYTVVTTNGHLVLSQWAQTNDRASDSSDNNNIDDTPEATIPGSVPGGRNFTRYIYEDQNNQTVMEKYIIDGMGHAWSGGSTAGSYTDPNGPNASQLMVDFFLAHPMNGSAEPTPPPTPTPPPNPTATPTPDPNPTATPPPTSTPTPASDITVELPSIAAEDGYTGKYLADGYSAATHKVGDKGMFNNDTYRGLLSFDTSGIPANAAITAVTLRLYRQSLNGTITAVDIDIRNGAFGSNNALQSSDYGASPTAPSIASFTPPSTNGSSVDVNLPSSAWQHINRNGRTQLRLRATTPWDFTADHLTFYGGEDSSLAPLLIVTYEP